MPTTDPHRRASLLAELTALIGNIDPDAWRAALGYLDSARPLTLEQALAAYDAEERRIAASLTPAQRAALVRATTREGGYVCPTSSLRGAAQELVLEALRTRGLITHDVAPVITEAGRRAVATAASGAS